MRASFLASSDVLALFLRSADLVTRNHPSVGGRNDGLSVSSRGDGSTKKAGIGQDGSRETASGRRRGRQSEMAESARKEIERERDRRGPINTYGQPRSNA